MLLKSNVAIHSTLFSTIIIIVLQMKNSVKSVSASASNPASTEIMADSHQTSWKPNNGEEIGH